MRLGFNEALAFWLKACAVWLRSLVDQEIFDAKGVLRDFPCAIDDVDEEMNCAIGFLACTRRELVQNCAELGQSVGHGLDL